MSRRCSSDSPALQRLILRLASLLVPFDDREKWLKEWTSELWHLWDAHSRRTSGWMRIRSDITRFCAGAFKDAIWLRRNSQKQVVLQIPRLHSPVLCMTFLIVLTAVSVFFAFYLPGPRDAIWPVPFRDEGNLVVISPDGRSSGTNPSVTFQEYQAMVPGTREVFAGLAFYRPTSSTVSTARHRAVTLRIAVTSPSLFSLLNLPPPTTPINLHSAPSECSRLVLGSAAWRKYFDSDPHVAGRLLSIDGRPVVVAGIAANSLGRLPGSEDAWLIEDARGLATVERQSKGFLLGHVRAVPSLRPKKTPWHVSVPGDKGIDKGFGCEPLVQRGSVWGQLFMIGVAMLILPTLTKLTLGEYPANANSSLKGVRSRRWIFLGLKVALILPLVFFGTIDLGPVIGWTQPQAALIGYVLAFRWILVDQRRRCPVCLRLLTNPTRIGRPSATLLEWYGTELICARGHGLQHVSGISTISFGTQRWLYLDQSWRSLFSQ